MSAAITTTTVPAVLSKENLVALLNSSGERGYFMEANGNKRPWNTGDIENVTLFGGHTTINRTNIDSGSFMVALQPQCQLGNIKKGLVAMFKKVFATARLRGVQDPEKIVHFARADGQGVVIFVPLLTCDRFVEVVTQAAREAGIFTDDLYVDGDDDGEDEGVAAGGDGDAEDESAAAASVADDSAMRRMLSRIPEGVRNRFSEEHFTNPTNYHPLPNGDIEFKIPLPLEGETRELQRALRRICWGDEDSSIVIT